MPGTCPCLGQYTTLSWRGHDAPDSKVHGANMGLIWGRQDPGGPHVGPMNFAIWYGNAFRVIDPLLGYSICYRSDTGEGLIEWGAGYSTNIYFCIKYIYKVLTIPIVQLKSKADYISSLINGYPGIVEGPTLRAPLLLYNSLHWKKWSSLQWSHNHHDGVSNHQPNDCLFNRLFRHRSKKHQFSASLAFVWGIHQWPLNCPHKGQVTRKIFPFDDVIMWLKHSNVHEDLALGNPTLWHGRNTHTRNFQIERARWKTSEKITDSLYISHLTIH